MYELSYVFDAYCGWCYGFGPAISELAHADDITVTVRHGSLFAADNRAAIGSFPHIPAANQRISELTGVSFGENYAALLADGTFVLDSDDAARGLAALIQRGGSKRAIEFAKAMQEAFYLDGRSLSDPESYRAIAETTGLDAGPVVAALDTQATADFAREAQEWNANAGVRRYPTLLLHRADELVPIGTPASSAAQLRELLETTTRS